ncbi:MAG: hypothetical protein ACYC2H_10120 [Thermoplasmatota archaeon]
MLDWYPFVATALCLAMAGVFGLVEALVDELQRQADRRRAHELAAQLLNGPAAGRP